MACPDVSHLGSVTNGLVLKAPIEKQASINISDTQHADQFSIFRNGNPSEIFHAHVRRRL